MTSLIDHVICNGSVQHAWISVVVVSVLASC